MGKFNNKISAEFHPPRKWILERLLSYKNDDINNEALQAVGLGGKENEIRCTKGFVTDLASVPRVIWWLIAPLGYCSRCNYTRSSLQNNSSISCQGE